ncbi:GNAT family N-acetyltransferase [Alkalicoccus chagannorensis]|uniref:GNAT family N-acetyltransferase n=1 Tax=Alkalicoccus chagannorensis TaxID=427072 RepID=UPI000402A68A|nr:GNAT family N-acetyltransferase [Alkalicoccus chagannorensis]
MRQWYERAFGDLTTAQLYDILKARVDVFVVEQECAYPEIDGKDERSIHLFVQDSDGTAAYARLVPAGIGYAEPSIGRVLVRKSLRGTGLGREVMRRAVELMDEQGEPVITIQAQNYAKAFYESFGFEAVSEVYLEDDIPHVDMKRFHPEG